MSKNRAYFIRVNFMPTKEEIYSYLSEHGAELNYIAGTLVSDLTAEIRAGGSVLTLSPSTSLGVTVGWNYLDGLYAVMLGVKQFTDNSDYRQEQNKIKGMLNIFSGIQLFLLSYNPIVAGAVGLSGGAALAAPSFALATLCDLITATIDFYNANKEVEFKGWLDEKVKEYNHTNSQDLKRDIYSRCKVYINGNPNESDSIFSILPDNFLLDIETDSLSDNDRYIDNKLQNEINQNYSINRKNLLIKGMSFTGMTLLAVAPIVSAVALPALIVGLALTTFVALTYLNNNADKFVSSIDNMNLSHRFFGDRKSIANNETNDIKLMNCFAF